MLDDDTGFQIVVNDEDQYSIWPTGRKVPAGWRAAGFTGARAECLSYVDRTWVDMRPASLRRVHDRGRDPAMGEGPASRHAPGGVRTVVDLFERQLRTRPDAIAIRTSSRSVTYAEFGRTTAHLAHRLRRRGVGPGSVVGLLAPRGIEALTGVLAIMRCGAACLPLAPDDPPRRNREILDDVRCEHVVVTRPTDWLPDAELVESTPRTGGAGTADAEHDDLGLDDDALLPSPDPFDLAYAITTSGSTGRPKVVGVPHVGIFNLVVASLEDLDLVRPDDVMLWTTAVTVDSSMHDFLMPLCCGACVAVADAAELPASRVVATCRTLGVTVLELPAAVLGPYGRSLLPRLAAVGVRLVITGGSQLDGPGLAEAPVVVWNGYGPTEASVAATWHRCDDSTPNWVPIGRPIRGVRTHVLDEGLEPVPLDTEGELCIGGLGVAQGYLGLPGRTASVFLPDPFADRPGTRMYATGDRVRLRPDGVLVFVGRVDSQVQLNGFRVEIGEVEHALRGCPGVADATVLLREDVPGGAAVVAFLAGGRGNDDVVVKRLRDRLPKHMIPRFYVWFDELPLNRQGKVDRAALTRLPLDDVTRTVVRTSDDT